MSKPFENAGWNQKAGRNLRSTACREIIVLKEAKSKTKRKNYLQKQSYHYIKEKDCLAAQRPPLQPSSLWNSNDRSPSNKLIKHWFVRKKPLNKFLQLEGKFPSVVQSI